MNTALFDAVRNLDNFRGEDRRAFRSYLYQITRRRVADEFRRHNRQPKTVGELNPESSELVDLGASTFDDRVVDGHMIDEFLGRLTEEQREILEMRVMTGLSIRETADRTGRSEMAVKAMQRRALLSLRTIVLAAAVLLIAVLGVRALTGDGGVVVVENGPAGEGSDGGSGDEQGLASGVGESAEAPVPLVVEAGPDEDAGSDEESEAAADDRSDDETKAAAGSDDGSDGPTTTASGDDERGASGDDAGDADEDRNESQERASSTTTATTVRPTTTVASNPAPTTPCNVFHDGSPAAGELGFVDYDFSGPYTFLKDTTVALVGNGSGDPILGGYGNRAKVADGTRFPFLIGDHMIKNGKLEVSSKLAGGQLTAVCRTAGQRLQRPCNVFHDGTPAVGEEGEVVYRVLGPYDIFSDELTYVIGARNRSAMVDDDPTFSQSGRHAFTIDNTMMVDGKLTVRTAFAGGDVEAACWVKPADE